MMLGARISRSYGITDDFWSDVKLLLLMDGTNGSTTFTDSSSFGKTVTAGGTSQLTTSDFKYGTASGDFTTNGDELTLSSADSDFYTTDVPFTIECWIKPTDNVNMAGNTNTIYDRGLNIGITLMCGKGGLIFRGPSTIDLSDTTTISTSAWTHIAFQYETTPSDVKRIFINGTQVQNTTQNINQAGSYTPEIGSCNTPSSNNRYEGLIDEFRYTGAARYTSSGFTPAQAPLS